MNDNRILDMALKYLEHPKWHVREECLTLLTMNCLMKGPKNLMSNMHNLAFVAERLTDDKAKVRSNAIDLYCVIVSKDQTCVNAI